MPGYFEEARVSELLRQYPIGEAFLSGPAAMSRDELHALQDRRLREVVARGWQVPFYDRLWRAAGIEPGDIRGIEDVAKLPSFDKADLMASVAAHPPFGDFHGLDLNSPDRFGAVLHTTSGTTGDPQPLFFGAWDREVQNLLLARAYRLQGLRDDDVVHSVYGFGMVNGGHYVRETVLHYTKALLLSAGTGLETRSQAQVQLMQRFGATVLLGFADYIRKLADVAREVGLVPGEDIPVRLISGHLGDDGGEALSRAWGGATVLDWYGVGDTGIVAAEGPDRDGLYIWEDAQLVELLDPETGVAVEPGRLGDICVTCLFKNTVYPVIRFNTHDVTHELSGSGSIGIDFRRIAGFRGRSDNMVKLRGINVFPTAIAGILSSEADLTGEYICRLTAADGREELTVVIEAQGMTVDREGGVEALTDLWRQRLGVEVKVELVAPGATASMTQVDSRQKPIRLLDERR